jgi:membrane-associated phospholipid phosphatase
MLIAFGLALVCALLAAPGLRRARGSRAPLFVRTGPHWRRMYGRRSFLRLGAGVAVAGVLAYSGADTALEGWHARRVRGAGSDVLARLVKHFGERYWFFVWLMVGAVDAWVRTGPFSRWGRTNFEAMAVGLPTLWTVQRGLGANRPSSDDADPRWRPLAADNSASGHAFIAAVPWLNLARRTDSRVAAAIARAASWLTGWSRLNDRKHYVSQIVLGWVIAWNAVSAVDAEGAPDASKGSS